MTRRPVPVSSRRRPARGAVPGRRPSLGTVLAAVGLLVSGATITGAVAAGPAPPSAGPAPVVAAPPTAGQMGAGQAGTAQTGTAQLGAAAAATGNPDCTLIVPADPLTATGLASPYLLLATNANLGPCDMANPGQRAFVQAAVLDPATGQMTQYQPLVVNGGQAPAAKPAPPTLPDGAVVALWITFSGRNLTLIGGVPNTLEQNGCVTGVAGAPFGRFAYCNAQAFQIAARQTLNKGLLALPQPAKGKDAQPCPTTRDFAYATAVQGAVVESTYLLTPAGMAQNTADNRAAFPGATVVQQPEAATHAAVLAALGCKPFGVADLSEPGVVKPTIFGNQLQGASYQTNPALAPSNAPMLQINGMADVNQTNQFRTGLLQNPLAQAGPEQAPYCTAFRTAVTTRYPNAQVTFTNTASPDPTAAANLFTFLARQANETWVAYNCSPISGQTAPFQLTTDANGAVVSAAVQTATA